MIFTCSLQSGSNGNSFYVETADARLLFDAGISAKLAEQRLARHKRDIRKVDALIISHNHSDHVKHAGVFQRKFSFPIYITRGAWRVSRSMLGMVNDLRYFEPGQMLQHAQTTIKTVPTPHDGIDSVAFVIFCRGKKLGIFTDLGHRFQGIERWINDLDLLYLESNYDPEMLARGPYPLWLQNRIRGEGGHLSNTEAAQIAGECTRRLQLLILSHISEHNNRPEIALATAQDILGRNFPLALSRRTDVSEMFTIR